MKTTRKKSPHSTAARDHVFLSEGTEGCQGVSQAILLSGTPTVSSICHAGIV